MRAPKIAPAAIPFSHPAISHPQAKACGIGMWMYVPKPDEMPSAKPINAPRPIPATSDFGLTRREYEPTNMTINTNVTM
jgi:hypothetical protein